MRPLSGERLLAERTLREPGNAASHRRRDSGERAALAAAQLTEASAMQLLRLLNSGWSWAAALEEIGQ